MFGVTNVCKMYALHISMYMQASKLPSADADTPTEGVVSSSERTGNTFKRFKYFNLKAKAKIWP